MVSSKKVENPEEDGLGILFYVVKLGGREEIGRCGANVEFVGQAPRLLAKFSVSVNRGFFLEADVLSEKVINMNGPYFSLTEKGRRLNFNWRRGTGRRWQIRQLGQRLGKTGGCFVHVFAFRVVGQSDLTQDI